MLNNEATAGPIAWRIGSFCTLDVVKHVTGKENQIAE